MNKQYSSFGAGRNLAACLIILAAVNLACMGFKKPWRDYSPKPFSSAEWLAGDKIERGRMMRDMFRNPKMDISSREAAIKTLGEPDIKKTIENKEVWFYRIDFGIPDALDLMAISFDEKGRGSSGYAHGGTMSMGEKESELK
ncbi:MAG: hypothetical protein IPI64_13080 [Chloracidobacterium sp.]|nr:hypothetical protein [Chloracidobacterium sp.]